MRLRIFAFLVLFAILSSRSDAAAGKIEPTGAFDDGSASVSIRNSLEKTGYRVLLPDGTVQCEIWFRNNLPVTTTGVEGAIYHFAESELIGVIRFPKTAKDFRGQQLKTGSYTMRYELSPNDGNHLGVSPIRDFVLLLPLAADKDPQATYTFQELVDLSAQVSGTPHAAPLALMSSGKTPAPALTETQEGYHLLSVKLRTQTGSTLLFAIIVEGISPQ